MTQKRPAAGGWRRSLDYAMRGRLFHQPVLLRAIGRWLRRSPAASARLKTFADYRSVSTLFRRETSFSNSAHAGSLAAGLFAIGMDKGPLHDADRRFLAAILPSARRCGRASAAESRRRIAALRAGGATGFNLVDEYMTSVVWAALGRAFGPLASGLEGEVRYATPSGCPFKALYAELRYLGAYLVVGDAAPTEVTRKTVALAEALKARVDAHLDRLRRRWARHAPEDDDAIRRNAIGLMWVGHPATVQGGSLIVQELLARPEIYADLRRQAAELGDAAWTDARFRDQLKAHVLEMLRFRPPFPLLSRDVPRPTMMVDADDREIAFAAGDRAKLVTIGAMFDPEAVQHPDLYWPGRPDAAFSDPANRWLMFGLGPRACIGGPQVVEILASALAGLLLLPELHYADAKDRLVYDSVIVTRLRLAFTPETRGA